MSGIYSTKTPELSTLGDVDINLSTIANNDVLQYNSTIGQWDNGPLDLSGTDITVDEIDCRVLRVSETADINGRLATLGVASFVNDEFIFQNGVSDLGDTLYIDNVNKALALTGTNYGTAGAVLTSNGAGNATTWNSPYHIRALNTTNQIVAEGAYRTISFLQVDSDATTTNATGDFASNAWTPPAGIYQLNLQGALSRDSHQLFELRVALFKNGSAIRLTRLTDGDSGGAGSEIKFSSLNMSDIIVADGDDVFDFRVLASVVGASTANYTIRGDTDGAQTFFSAYKIG